MLTALALFLEGIVRRLQDEKRGGGRRVRLSRAFAYFDEFDRLSVSAVRMSSMGYDENSRVRLSRSYPFEQLRPGMKMF